MIINMPTDTMFKQWRHTFEKYKDRLYPNRISGTELLSYIKKQYVLTELYDENALNTVVDNVVMNETYKEKLPFNTLPVPKAFYLENSGNGVKFYRPENKDSNEIWGGNITRIL